jgi:ubiquinone/menaquinone biosynthesis C-methylase UbiE
VARPTGRSGEAAGAYGWRMDTTSARYDGVADFYVDLFGDSVDDPATAALLELIGPIHGRRVLDLACGHGRVARALATRGAAVVGVDVSASLLEHAQAREDADPLGIRYVRLDAAATDSLAGERYDVVVCNYGLSDVDDLEGVLATVARVLGTDGAFIFSFLHPCFPGWGPEVSGSWPTGRGYYEEGWWLSSAASSGIRRRVGATHRTLSTYFNALAAHGLAVECVSEPEPSWEHWLRQQPGDDPVPVFLVARCRRIALTEHTSTI